MKTRLRGPTSADDMGLLTGQITGLALRDNLRSWGYNVAGITDFCPVDGPSNDTIDGPCAVRWEWIKLSERTT